MENPLEGKRTGILDLANIYLREKITDNGTDKQNQKSQAESIQARLQKEGDIDKDLRVLYWKNYEELKQKLLDAIVSDLKKDTKEEFNPVRPYELLEKAEKNNNQPRRPSYLQILSPYKGEEFGTGNINLELQDSLIATMPRTKERSVALRFSTKLFRSKIGQSLIAIGHTIAIQSSMNRLRFTMENS